MPRKGKLPRSDENPQDAVFDRQKTLEELRKEVKIELEQQEKERLGRRLARIMEIPEVKELQGRERGWAEYCARWFCMTYDERQGTYISGKGWEDIDPDRRVFIFNKMFYLIFPGTSDL